MTEVRTRTQRRSLALSGLDHRQRTTPELLVGLVDVFGPHGHQPPSRARSIALDLVGTAAGSLVLGVAATKLDSQALSSAVMPAVGWALAWLLLRPANRWPAIVAGTIAGELGCSLIAGGAGWQHGPRVAATTLAVLVTALLHQRWRRPGPMLATRRNMLALFAAVAVGAAVGACVAALSEVPGGYGASALSWWRSATLGQLVAVPLLVALTEWWRDGHGTERSAEAAALGLAIAASATVVFVLGDLHLEYLLLPLLALCAYRFGMFGGAGAVAALTTATFAVDVPGTGMAHPQRFNDATVAQLFFIGAAMITLLLAAEVTDYRRLIAQRDAAAAGARQRQRRLEALAEHAADVSVVVDRRGVVTYASPNVTQLLGRTKGRDRSLSSALHWVHPDDRADATGWLQAVLDGAAGASRRVELRLRRSDGSAVWVEAVASNWVDEPSVGGVVLNLRDVTLRRRSEELNRALFEAMWEGAVLLDARGVITRVDGSTSELLGTTPESLIGRQASELIPEAFRADALRRLRSPRSTFGGSATREQHALPYAHPDGSVRWFSVSAAALREADGSVRGYAVLLADLSAFYEARRARRLAERRYRSIVESSHEGIVLTSPEGRITFANGRAAILCGCATTEELVGRSVGELFDAGSAAGSHPELTTPAAGAGATWSRCRVRRADGALRWMHWTVTAIATDDGTHPDHAQPSGGSGGGTSGGGMMHVFLDVTDQVELEERRGTMAAELALAAEQERRRLAADLHDGPIQRLAAAAMQLGSAAVRHAQRPALAEELTRAESLVRGTTTELRELLFQLAPPDLTDSGLAMAISRAADMLLGSIGVDIEVRAELDVEPDPVISLAAYRIAQESLSNVRVHAGAAEVVVTLRRRAGGLLLEVRDDGVGCEPTRLHAAKAGHLGLRSMRERAGDLGGWCRVDSIVGVGTTVTVWLPARAERPAGPPGAAVAGGAAGAVPAQLAVLPAERQS